MSEVSQAGSSGQRQRVIPIAPVGLRHEPLDGEFYVVKQIMARGPFRYQQFILSQTSDGPPLRFGRRLRRFEAKRFKAAPIVH